VLEPGEHSQYSDLATGWAYRGSSPSRCKGVFSKCLERIRGPPSPLLKAYEALFPGVESGRGARVTAHLHLVPKLRITGAILPLPYIPS